MFPWFLSSVGEARFFSLSIIAVKVKITFKLYLFWKKPYWLKLAQRFSSVTQSWQMKWWDWQQVFFKTLCHYCGVVCSESAEDLGEIVWHFRKYVYTLSCQELAWSVGHWPSCCIWHFGSENRLCYHTQPNNSETKDIQPSHARTHVRTLSDDVKCY